MEEEKRNTLNVPAFQALLLSYIGSDSRVSFARRADISPEHLSRMLSTNSRWCMPSKTTLGKIARAANVDPSELFRVCGYSDSDMRGQIMHERSQMTLPERSEAVANDIIHGFEKIISDHKIFASFAEVGKAYDDTVADRRNVLCAYTGESFCTFDKDPVGNINTSPYSGEMYLPCSAYWEMFIPGDEEYKYAIHTLFVLFYARTANSNIILTDVAIDGQTVNYCGLVPPAMAEALYEDGEDVSKLPHVELVKKIKRPKLGNSAAERLLKAVFGEYDTEDYKKLFTIETGLGFFWTQTPETFNKFLADSTHRSAFRMAGKDDHRSEERVELCMEIEDCCNSAAEIDAEFARYGWTTADAIVRVMDRELKDCFLLPEGSNYVRYDSNQEDPNAGLLPVIYVSEDAWMVNGMIDGEKRREIDQYIEGIARELHLPSCGDVIAYHAIQWDMRDMQRPLQYDKNEPDEDQSDDEF